MQTVSARSITNIPPSEAPERGVLQANVDHFLTEIEQQLTTKKAPFDLAATLKSLTEAQKLLNAYYEKPLLGRLCDEVTLRILSKASHVVSLNDLQQEVNQHAKALLGHCSESDSKKEVV